MKIVGKRYVIVNIPAAQIEAIENDTVVSRHSGVVGKPDRPTPLLRSTIAELNFNPMWTLPPTVIKEDLIPKGRDMQQGAGRAREVWHRRLRGRQEDQAEKINWSSASRCTSAYRQAPGKDNPLGS